MKTKGVVSVVVGFITVALLSVGTDALMEQIGVFPSTGEGLFSTNLLLLAFTYRSVFTILGGYVTAHLAPNNPMKFVKTLGAVGTIAGVLGVVAGWDLSDHWYPIAIAATGFLFTWIGGKIYCKINTINK
jgi:hypothetical protein